MPERTRGSSMFERYRRLLGPDSVRDVDDELDFHLDMRIREAIERGVEPQRAREQALARLGDLATQRAECLGIAKRRERKVARAEIFSELRQDAGYTMRSLSRTPAVTVAAILTIALGVAATTIVLTLINGLLFRPLPVASAEDLYALHEQRTGSSTTSFGQVTLKLPRFEAYREGTTDVFTGFAGDRPRKFALRTRDGARPVEGALTAGDYFGVLGLRPAIGRFFNDDTERSVVIGHTLWQSRFAGSADALGSTIWLDGRPLSVVGVAPRKFAGVHIGPETEVWVPARAYQSLAGPDSNERDFTFRTFGRIAPGVELPRAKAAVELAARRNPPDEPGTEVQGATLERLTLLPAAVRAPVMGFFGVLLGTATLVLLIAAANIAGMLLARGVARRRELAVRLALGAGRARLMRQLLKETLALFILGGLLGMIFAVWGSDAVRAFPMPFDGTVNFDLSPDWQIFAISLAGTALIGLIFGLAPALQGSRVALVPALKEGGAHGATRTDRGRSLFVAAQLAMAVLLLVTTGLFVRSLQRVLNQGPGFDAGNVIVASIDLAPHGYDETKGEEFYARLAARIAALPGIEASGLASVVLLSGESESNDVKAVDPIPGSVESGTTSLNIVDAGYMETLRIPLVAGRLFQPDDRRGATPAVVINDLLARRLFPDGSALGRRIAIAGTELEVVGVVANGRYVRADEPPRAFAFIHSAANFTSSMTMHVRARPGVSAHTTIEAIREAVRGLDPDVAVEDARPMLDLMATTLFMQRFAALLIGAFGFVGLLLAAVGVYSVLAFHVAQRTREIGVRVALGARSHDVLRMVLGRGAMLAAMGAGVGILLALGAGKLLRGFLLGLSPSDPVTLTVVPLLLIGVSLAAAYFPARRATRVDPVRALRME